MKICSNSNTVVSDKHTHTTKALHTAQVQKLSEEVKPGILNLKSVTWRKMRSPKEVVYNVESDRE